MSWLTNLFGGDSPDRTEEILSRHLDRDFIVFPMAEAAASEASVAAIGHRLGVRYPPEFMNHVCGRLPGVYIEAKESVWPRGKAHDVGPFWTFLYAVHSFTPLVASEDWMRLDRAAERFQANSGLQAAPILKIKGDANVYCVDGRGSILAYDHESNTLAPTGLDFWQLLEREVAELVERKNRLLNERADS